MQKRPVILRSLLIVTTPYSNLCCILEDTRMQRMMKGDRGTVRQREERERQREREREERERERER